MSITIDDKKIEELEIKMRIVYQTWEEMILRKDRDRKTKEGVQPSLNEDEGDEEQYEYKKYKEEMKNKDLYEKGIDISQWQTEN